MYNDNFSTYHIIWSWLQYEQTFELTVNLLPTGIHYIDLNLRIIDIIQVHVLYFM